MSLYQETVGQRELFDPAGTLGGSPLVGTASTLGIFFWAAGARMCFLTYGAIRRTSGLRGRRFFLAAGAFTALLMIDDGFLPHEYVLPYQAGIRERYDLTGYLAVAAAFVLGLVKFFLRNNFSLALLFGIFVSSSLIFDFPPLMKARGWWKDQRIVYAAEDRAKLTGITLWISYLGKTSLETLQLFMRGPVVAHQ
jgi:hypothetical protein